MSLFLKKSEFVIVTLLAVFLLRLPSLFEPYWYGDEGIYLTLGLGIKKGLLLYRDIFDNKTPLIYLLAAVADGRMFYFRFLLLVSVLATIYFFYRLAQHFFPRQHLAVVASTLLLALLTTIPRFEGNIANAEIFILLPTILGLYLLLAKERYFTGGLVLALGFLLKVPAVFDLIAVLFFWLFYHHPRKKFVLERRWWTLTLAYSLPIVLSLVYFGANGALAIYLRSAFFQTLGYLSSWKTGSHTFSLFSLAKSELALKGLALLVFCYWLWLKRKVFEPKTVFLFLWFLFSLFGVTLSGRPYPHYLIQAFPALILLLASLAKTPRALAPAVVSLALITATLLRYQFWAYPTFAYYRNFLSFTLGWRDKTTYFTYFNPELPVIYRLAEVVKSYTQTSDRLFVWADEPHLYPLTRRLPATPYVAAYHIRDFNLYRQVLADLISQPPPIVVIDRQHDPFPQLESQLLPGYRLIETVGQFEVYLFRHLDALARLQTYPTKP